MSAGRHRRASGLGLSESSGSVAGAVHRRTSQQPAANDVYAAVGVAARMAEDVARSEQAGFMVRTNWARNIAFTHRRFHEPGSVEQLQEIVANSRSLRVLGTGHSFNRIADTGGDLVSVARLPRVAEIDRGARTVTVGAGLRYGDIVEEVHRAGFALPNLASLPHISIAGACATGTHGSGVGNGTLSSAVRALELIGADGSPRTIGRADPGFPGSVVALGALGVVTRLTLDLVPAFELGQWVYEGLPLAALREDFDLVMSAAYSVSLFTDWQGDRVNQVWVKSARPDPAPEVWLGAARAAGPRHPVPGGPPESCTAQLGVPGPWHSRLPHFVLGFTPSSGDELQSEYFVARADAVAALDALHAVRDRVAPPLLISEIRTVAADDLWLSPAHGRDSVAFHFTWRPDARAVAPAVSAIEQALAPFGARPHWGKVHGTFTPDDLRALYPRYDDFAALLRTHDPAGKFRNDHLDELFPV